MITNLSAGEREVWKELYAMHESIHDMAGDAGDWELFAKKIMETSKKYDGTEQRLFIRMAAGLYDYMSEEQRIREEDARLHPAPEQIVMEEIPWS